MSSKEDVRRPSEEVKSKPPSSSSSTSQMVMETPCDGPISMDGHNPPTPSTTQMQSGEFHEAKPIPAAEHLPTSTCRFPEVSG